MSAKPTCLIVASAAPQGKSANLIHHFEDLCSDKYTVLHSLKKISCICMNRFNKPVVRHLWLAGLNYANNLAMVLTSVVDSFFSFRGVSQVFPAMFQSLFFIV